MPTPTLYGAAYSVYVRAVRLTLAEKGVPCRLVEVDVFAPGGPPAEHLARQPFGKIPAFEHDGFKLYETGAITRYVDEAFDGPALTLADLHAAPMFDLFLRTPEGAEALARHARLAAWWAAISARPSFADTASG